MTLFQCSLVRSLTTGFTVYPKLTAETHLNMSLLNKANLYEKLAFKTDKKMPKLKLTVNIMIQPKFKFGVKNQNRGKFENFNTCTSRGFPNLRALSRFFLNESSKKLVLVIFLSLYSFIINSVACPEGSIINGYLLNLFNMIAFSVHRSSAGRVLACHLSLSSALDRYWNTQVVRTLLYLQKYILTWRGFNNGQVYVLIYLPQINIFEIKMHAIYKYSEEHNSHN